MEGTLAEIRMFAGNFAPKAWAFCLGQQLAINTNTALFSLLGTTYGGNGQSTFGLPNFAGRVAVGPSPQVGDMGAVGGEYTHTLLSTEMPMHTHTAVISGGPMLSVSSANASMSTPQSGSVLAAPGTAVGRSFTNTFGYSSNTPAVQLNAMNLGNLSVTNAIAGSSQPHPNMQPYLGMNFIICVQGIFPSRN